MWVGLCNRPVGSGEQCFLGVALHLWLSPSFCPKVTVFSLLFLLLCDILQKGTQVLPKHIYKPVQNNIIYIYQNLSHLNVYWQDNGEHKGWLSRPGLFSLSISKVFSVESRLGSWEISDLCIVPPSYVESPIPGSQIVEGENQFCPLTSTLRQWWTCARACAHRKKGWLQVLWLLLLHPVPRINSVVSASSWTHILWCFTLLFFLSVPPPSSQVNHPHEGLVLLMNAQP